MVIRSVVHKGLRRFLENDDVSGLPAAAAGKIRRMVSFLLEMSSDEELRTVPAWNAHLLTGGRKGYWSLSVTRNWRLTFRIDRIDREIVDLNFEDYH